MLSRIHGMNVSQYYICEQREQNNQLALPRNRYRVEL